MHDDYLVIVDESHVSLSQFRGMYAGDRSRKEVLVDHGFRLPSALDNRPLMFDEYINKAPHFLFASATPNELGLELSSVVAEQVVRPTALLFSLRWEYTYFYINIVFYIKNKTMCQIIVNNKWRIYYYILSIL